MNKLVMLVCAILSAGSSFAQSVTELPNDYRVDLDQLDRDGTIAIRTNSQPEVHVKLTPGDYFLSNPNERFWFSVDNSLHMVGTAKYENLDQSFSMQLHFAEGKLVNGQVTDSTDRLLVTMEVKGNEFISKTFDSNGKVSKQLVKGNREGKVYFKETEYYDGGAIKAVRDDFEQTTQTYYEDGTPQLYIKNYAMREAERIENDPQGNKILHVYDRDQVRYTEKFVDGIIQSREFRKWHDDNIRTEYYKDGVLDYYEVVDLSKSERSTYDKTDRLIKREKTPPRQFPPSPQK